jgi:hypothetical protein
MNKRIEKILNFALAGVAFAAAFGLEPKLADFWTGAICIAFASIASRRR